MIPLPVVIGDWPMDRIVVRDAKEADIPSFVEIKGAGSTALHRDRLRDAQDGCLRYLVLVLNAEIIGFAVLVFRRPASWSDADDPRHLPQIVDLQVAETWQGQGYGSAFVHAIERIATAAGFRELYLGVDPLNNPRAYALYRRLGYEPLQSEPYREHWEFRDSAGQVHRGEGWAIDLVKLLGA